MLVPQAQRLQRALLRRAECSGAEPSIVLEVHEGLHCRRFVLGSCRAHAVASVRRIMGLMPGEPYL